MNQEPEIQKRSDGRSKAAKDAKTTAARKGEIAAAQAAVQQRAAARQASPRATQPGAARGRVTATGRDGEELSRRRTSTGDIFNIPPELIEKGWEMQWIAVSVVGNQEVVMDQNLMMLENGWRPVMAERFPGRFMPAGHKGHIIRGGQGLYERPKVLSDEARSEDIRAARQLVTDRNESLKLTGVKNQLGAGFEMNSKYRGTGGDIRMSIDRALDAPTPEHQLAEPGE